MNMLDCQIFSLGHQYRVIGRDPEAWLSSYQGVAFLPLNKERGEFVVIFNYSNDLVVLRNASCKDVLAFRGRFYAVFLNGDVFVIDPYSLVATPLNPAQPMRSVNYLVQSGNDELFLVEATIPEAEVIMFSRLTCRASRLDEEAGEWVVVSDFGDRILF
ncbi:hypothetical protein CARUB_v10024828mg, partial [Capsella rubella]